MRIELTIKADYVPSWKVWEGMRELIQNGLDAEEEFNASFTIKRKNGTVTLQNDNVTMSLNALLIGHTTKQGKNLRGTYGEGLNLGLLALVRLDKHVRIYSGSEIWTAMIATSKQFAGEQVLMIDVFEGSSPINDVRVEIDNITDDEWKMIESRFLCLQIIEDDDVVNLEEGMLLLNPTFQGQMYCKGIYVQTNPKLLYGYNYELVTLDRDRQMISSWDCDWHNAKIWEEATAKRPDLFPTLFKHLQDNTPDVVGFADIADYTNNDFVEQISKQFFELHGETAVATDNLEQSRQMEHMGRRGVVTPAALAKLIRRKSGSLESIHDELNNEVIKTYSWFELDNKEKDCLHAAAKLIQDANKFKNSIILKRVQVVDFRSEDILGQHQRSTGECSIAKKVLTNFKDTLTILVHEISHDVGGDGDHAHVSMLEEIWGSIVIKLLDI